MKNFFLFFCCSLFALQTIKAQDYSEIFDVGEDGFSPMNIIMEPNYDENGKLLFYSIGNILRLYTDTYPNGNIKSKTLKRLGYESLEYENVLRKDYKYDSNNRIIEENIWGLRKYLVRGMIDPPYFLGSKKHYYSNNGHIDSLVTTNVHVSQYGDITSDDIKTLSQKRFLNKAGKPDSIYYYNKEIISGKHYVTYDDQNREKQMRTTYANGNAYTMNIKYSGGNRTCSVSSNAYKKVNHISQIIERDNLGRITRSVFKDNMPKTSIDYRYSYDGEGRTIVSQKEINIEQLDVLKSFLDKGNIKYDLQYKDDKQECRLYRCKEEEKKYELQYIYLLSLSPSGKITEAENYYFYKYSYGLCLDYGIKYTRKYNNQDLLIENIQLKLNKNIDILDDKKWDYIEKEVFDYDSYGNEILEETYKYEEDEWKGVDKMQRTYNKDNRVATKIEYDWKWDRWINKVKCNYTYTPEGDIVSKDVYYWEYAEFYWSEFDVEVEDSFGYCHVADGYFWKPAKRYTQTFTPAGSLQNKTNYRPQFILTKEYMSQNAGVGYYAVGAVKEVVSTEKEEDSRLQEEILADTTKLPKWKWLPKDADEYEYTPTSKQVSHYEWRENVKTPIEREIISYDNETQKRRIFSWDKEKQEWKNPYETSF